MLNIENLNLCFQNGTKKINILEDINLRINDGEKLALIGESGCGKSILALAIMNLLPQNAILTGKIYFNNINLNKNNSMTGIRGKLISICWSNPEKYLNPSKTIGDQITEAYIIHNDNSIGKNKAKARTLEILEYLNFPEPIKIYKSYSFQLSGGMNQRAMIAMSIINNPALLILDEPTRGLDDKNIELFKLTLEKIKCESILLITHDLALAKEYSTNTAIMKNGVIIEQNDSPAFFRDPGNEYSKLFLNSNDIIIK
jgi:ABC-type dipeptide/oligopeptide/nickel transport system ATPase component